MASLPANKKRRRTIKDGETIFREGQTARSVFVLREGHVELAKAGERGAVRLALLQPGDLFGETGVLDTGPRSATAVAVGPVTVEEIPGEEFVALLRSDSELALHVLGQLAGRLRATSGQLARAPAAAGGAAPGRGQQPARAGSGFLARFFGVADDGTERDRLSLRLAPLIGDDDRTHTKALQALLAKRKGTRLRLGDRAVDLPAEGAIGRAQAVTRAARQWLASSGADVLIWGEVVERGQGVILRFAPASREDESQPGCFAGILELPLPLPVPPALADVAFATALAALTPASEPRDRTLRDILPAAFEAALTAGRDAAADLTTRERAGVLACIGNAAAAIARLSAAAEAHQVSADLYKDALGMLDPTGWAAEWGLLQRNRGVALQALGEQASDPQRLAEAAECFRAALPHLDRARFPRYWADLHNRQGVMFYRLDLQTGDSNLVSHALTSFQMALQVFTRVEHPMRWAEVMNNFGQAAQLLGGQLRNAEVLTAAADACRNALDVRTQEATPFLWAATQNNLGSALFLLGKLTRDIGALESAQKAFSQARDLYADYGATRLQSLAERNLGHVNRLLDEIMPRSIPRLKWEPDDALEALGEGEDAAEPATPEPG